MNRNGGTYTQGLDNSAANTSIILIPQTFTAHAAPLAQWDATMDCLRAVWAPYDVRVTDVEPNASEPPYMEVAVVAEAGTDIGYPAGVTGVAPHSCGVEPSAVGFVFVGSLSSSEPTLMCNQINFIAGKFFGLETLGECTDVMSWPACDGGLRTFADQELKCYNSFTPGCECGGTTQNSHATLLARAGAATCK